MQDFILAKYASEDLRVYTVWLPRPMGGLRGLWDSSVMPDPRALHYWDGEGITAQWFARQVDGYDGFAWDVFYLYGPDAEWEAVPAPLIASGGTIYAQRDTLRTEIPALLSD